MKEVKDYSKNNIFQTFISIFPVHYFSFVAQCLGNMINGLFVGNYLSNLDMSAIGFYNPFTTIIFIFTTIITAGARILCGRYIGKGQKEKINETYTIAIHSIFVCGLVLSLLSIFLSSPLAKLLGASGIALSSTKSYMISVGLGILPSMLASCLIVFLQINNKSRYTFISALLLAVCNFGFDFICVKVFTPSIFAIGLCNSLSQLVTFIFVLCVFKKNKTTLRIIKTKDSGILKDIVSLGLPLAFFNIMIALRNIVFNRATMASGGENAISGLAILNSSVAPFDGVSVAITTVSTMLASIYCGEKDRASIRQLYKISVLFGEALTILRLIIIILFTSNIASLFGASKEVIAYAKDLYLFAGIGMPINILIIPIMSVYQSLGKTMHCNILYFVSVLLANVFCSYYLSIYYGVNGVWFGYVLQEIVNLAGAYILSCIRRKKVVMSIDDILFYDNDLDVGKHITISITNPGDIIYVSRKIESYCVARGVEKKRAMYSGLCLEEITSNIFEHGFASSKKKNKTVDIYCDVDDDTNEVNIRVKDNGVAFDPYIKINENSDAMCNVGLKIVSKLSKNMNYQNNFGLNVLTIDL